MITNVLIENMYAFVKRIGAVTDKQLFRMFSEGHDQATVEFCLKTLLAENKIKRSQDSGLLIRRQSLIENDYGQILLTRAAWVLADMGERGVREYFPVNYPSQLFIIGENNICYDITVFTIQTLDSLRMAIPRYRATLLPPKVEDEVVHVALIPTVEIADRIKDLGFDNYCILDEDNKPQYHQWE